MNQKAREPFLVTRLLNFFLGIVILVLFLIILIKNSGTEIYEVLFFGLSAIQNFVGATVSFSEKKKMRGNIYAVFSGVFLIAAIMLAMDYFVFI